MADAAPIPLIDPHHHLWDAELHDYPWLSRSSAPIARRYLVDDFLADATGQALVKSVHVQGDIARHLSITETAWLQAIADRHGLPHGIVAYAPLQDPHLDAALEAHAQHANLRGIRQILNPDQCERPDYLTDPAWCAGYARLAAYGLSFDLQALPSQMSDAAAVARAYPDVPMVINHTGMPRDRGPEGLEAWRQGMRLLAEQPQVSVKISGFAMFDPDCSAENIRPLVLDTIDIFGVDRCMFASNFPVDKLHTSYAALFGAFATLTAAFSQTERKQLFHANAERIYRL
ncbi:MAG: amidohydrolase family protein [Chloroflexota bacterium]|nr:amidohydrolase family protein [Chloroflexota bacterium]